MFNRFSIALIVSTLGIAATSEAATYYVDSTGGSDSNSGTSSATPWKTLGKVNSITFLPGDTIRFRAGRQWPAAGDTTSQLHPLGSGNATTGPIKIDMYDTGAKPKIIGGGAGQRCLGGPSSSQGAVYLENQSYWEIRNLDVSNTGIAGCELVGIKIANNRVPAMTGRHIYIGNNTVHDVNGIVTGYYGTNAGISVTAAMNLLDPCPNWPSACPLDPSWTDVTIENNTIYAVDRIGIFVGPEWQPAGSDGHNFPLFPARMGSVDGSNPYGVTIRDNSLTDIGADAILTYIAANVTMEGNVVSASGSRVAITQCGTGCPSNWTGAANCNSAAIWTALTDNSVIQYNEVYDYALPNAQGHTQCDGQAFDTDWGTTNQIVQYNYSHHNQGGMHLTCETETTPSSSIAMNNIRVRYNVSYDDIGGAFTFACGQGTFPVGGDSMDINNNVVVVPSGRNMPIFGGSSSVPGTAYIYNNLFLVYGTTSYAQMPSAVFDFNTYYAPGYTSSRPLNEPCAAGSLWCPSFSYRKIDNHKHTADPMLVTTPAGTAPIVASNLGGLRLRVGSPELATGYQPGYGGDGIPNLGWTDFWGNATGLDPDPNRGAYNGPGL